MAVVYAPVLLHEVAAGTTPRHVRVCGAVVRVDAAGAVAVLGPRSPVELNRGV
jgi:hypothetical protein